MIQSIIIFFICSTVNVILNTVKTIVMYRQEKISSALVNAVTYGFYVVIVVMMAGEMNLYLKIILTMVSNFVGVWISMVIMDKFKRDKLWKIEVTIPIRYQDEIEIELSEISHSRIRIDNKYNLYNFYCVSQNDSIAIKKAIEKYDAKYFVSESKSL